MSSRGQVSDQYVYIVQHKRIEEYSCLIGLHKHKFHEGYVDGGMLTLLDGGSLSLVRLLGPLSVLSLDPTTPPGGRAGDIGGDFDHESLESIHPHHVFSRSIRSRSPRRLSNAVR